MPPLSSLNHSFLHWAPFPHQPPSYLHVFSIHVFIVLYMYDMRGETYMPWKSEVNTFSRTWVPGIRFRTSGAA